MMEWAGIGAAYISVGCSTCRHQTPSGVLMFLILYGAEDVILSERGCLFTEPATTGTSITGIHRTESVT